MGEGQAFIGGTSLFGEAEEKRKMRYIISVPNGYYEIEYGLVKGGGNRG